MARTDIEPALASGAPAMSAHERKMLDRAAEEEARRRRFTTVQVLVSQVFLLVLILVCWALASGRILDSLFVSDPWSVAVAFWGLLVDGTMWFHLRFTIVEMVVGYLVGASAGVGLAVLVSMLPSGEPIVRPLVLASYAIPKVALAPIIILWFGFGMTPKIVLAASLVFFIVYFNTLAGIADVKPGLIKAMRIMNASELAIYVKVVLPSAAVIILTGLQITIPAALTGAIIGELISGNRGIGYLISMASSQYQTDQVLAGIFALLVFVLILHGLLSALERVVLHWMPEKS